MAQERLGMREAREILRLKLELSRSDTEVAASVGRARSTISDCVKRAVACGLASWAHISPLSEAELEARLYPRSHGGRVAQQRVALYLEQVRVFLLVQL